MPKRPIYNRASELLARKARIENRRLSYRTVAEETGISQSSIQSWMKNKATRVDLHHIAILCKYLDCGIEELFVFVDDEEEERLPALAMA